MKNEKQTRVISHMNELVKVAGLIIHDDSDAAKISIYRKLRRMECRARRLAVAQCDYSTYSEHNDTELETIETRVREMFCTPDNVGVNRDPRGLALKIFGDYRDTSAVMDWGHNIIIAPEF